jgi:hypothetical protein
MAACGTNAKRGRVRYAVVEFLMPREWSTSRATAATACSPCGLKSASSSRASVQCQSQEHSGDRQHRRYTFKRLLFDSSAAHRLTPPCRAMNLLNPFGRDLLASGKPECA